MKRFKDAYHIYYNGASNPRAVARALVSAIDEVTEQAGSDAAADPAVQMILDHLCFLCGLPQPSLSMSYENWARIDKIVEENQS
jgi:hypothetical protein